MLCLLLLLPAVSCFLPEQAERAIPTDAKIPAFKPGKGLKEAVK